MQRLLTSADDLDAITENGIYWYYTEGIPANTPFKNASVVEVFGGDSNNTKKIQRVTRYGVPGQSAFRPMLSSAGWLDWAHYIMDSDYNIHQLPSNDLNNVTTPGNYLVDYQSKNIKNVPAPNKTYFSGVFRVNRDSNGFVTQSFEGNDYYATRRKFYENWMDWAIINPNNPVPNKLLWSGTFDQGSITIPDFDKYTLFRITLSNMATDIVATRHTNYLRGIGGTCWAEDETSVFFFGANVSSGNVITLVSCVERNFKNGTYKKCTVTGIYGLC